MKKITLLLIFIASASAQDLLTTVSGNKASGELIEITETHVIFQIQGKDFHNKIPIASVLQVVNQSGQILFSMEEEQLKEFEEKHKIIIVKTYFHGNKISKMYHLGTVEHLPLEINKKKFDTEKEAKNDGYIPCPACFDLRPTIPDYYFEKQLASGVNSAIRYNNEVLYEHPELKRVQLRLNSLLNQWTESLKQYDYRILIIKDISPNAFAVAGGNIYITTGLLKMIEDDSELDFIISHEIAHIERRHTLI